MIGAIGLERRHNNKKNKNIDLKVGTPREKKRGATIKELIKGLDVIKFSGKKTEQVNHLALDSRKVIPQTLFFAIKGFKVDGNQYVKEAIQRGATAIVTDAPHKAIKGITVIQVPDARLAHSHIARQFYQQPDSNLSLVGITGTNGKTTVSSLAQFLLQDHQTPIGLIGTIHYDLGNRTLPAQKTTPEALDLYQYMQQMQRSGSKRCIMEVSSHGIELKRVQNMAFNIAVFLNLTQDHLDFHPSMEDYYLSKRKLFTGGIGEKPSISIINYDDLYGQRLTKEIEGDVLTFGIHPDADFKAQDIQLSPTDTRFTLVTPEGSIPVRTQLLGHYNVSNALAALAISWKSGQSLQASIAKLEGFAGVHGRMERVDLGQPFTVLVDYAHTDDALKNGLTMLREITPNRLFVVFGCGGNRDQSKRPKMTAVVQKYADFAWATADNPRKEPLESIFNDMREGVTQPEKITFIPERRRAIDLALTEAKNGDCVLIAGKGHENHQILQDTVIPFDDRLVTKELLELKK